MVNPDTPEVRDILARVNRIPVWSLPWAFLAIIGIGYFFVFYDISDIGFAMPAISTQFHIGTSTSLFLALSIGLIGYAIGSYMIGSIADIYGRYRPMILTMALTALGSFGDGLSMNVPELAIFRFITGLGLGADLNLVSGYISEFAPPIWRGRISVYTFLIGIMGQALTPFIALGLVPVFYSGWRYLFFIGGIIAVIALIFRFELPESPRWLVLKAGNIEKARKVLDMMEQTAKKKVGTLPEAKPDSIEIAEYDQKFPTMYLFRKPYGKRMAILIVMWFLWYIGNYAFLGDAATMLSAAGITLSKSITYLAVGAVGYPVGALVMIFTADKIERKYVIFIDTVVWFIGLILFSFKIPSTIFAGSFLASMGLGMYLQVAYTYTAENYPTRGRASGFGLTDGLGHIGGALGALLLPVLVATYSFKFGFTFIAVTGLLAGIIALAGPKASRKYLENISK
ncbi:MAG: MFS transporter [Thermoplasmata archaeon]